METVLIFAGLLLLGAVVGFLAGLLGIGGGLLTVPFITMLLAQHATSSEQIVHMAVATSASTIVFTSLSSLRAHYAHRAILWPVCRTIVPGLLIGGFFGAQVASLLPMAPLALLFALFTAFSATQMLLGKTPKASRELPKRAGLVGVGTGIGVISSLIGAGGGFLSVPYLVWNNVPIRNAVATSAAMGFPIAAASTIGFIIAGWGISDRPAYSFGYVYVPALIAIATTSIFFAPLGARAAHRWPVATIRRCFAFLLYSLGGYMVWKAFSG
ncbi:MAG: sulfite exporter TauE/SafE family protein [Proteobacteria bacterium]|nr:sulfite exporter TauE/SafE family protein [Pseudomonadota bacterium]MCL2308072.1 sulfite exporter TauE/SafE family protein [Pseudomonadota bacterium]